MRNRRNRLAKKGRALFLSPVLCFSQWKGTSRTYENRRLWQLLASSGGVSKEGPRTAASDHHLTRGRRWRQNDCRTCGPAVDRRRKDAGRQPVGCVRRQIGQASSGGSQVVS